MAAPPRSRTGVSREEVVAALSLGTDVAMGQPLESGLGVCLVGLALAERAGLDEDLRRRVFYVSQLRHIGCTADSHAFAALVGDDIAFRDGVAPLDVSSPRALMPHMLRHLVRTAGLLGAVGKLTQMAAARDRLQEGVLAVCEVAELLAARLGLDEEIQTDLLLGNERWDGKSFLRRTREEGVPLAVRVVQIAECAWVYNAIGGVEAAAAVVRARAGGAFDPRLAELLAGRAAEIFAPIEAAALWQQVLDAAPGGERPLDEADLDAALGTAAEFVDLKSPFTAGHSTGVARLADAAARVAGLSPADVAQLRWSGLVHDLGRVAVPSPVWEKPGPLNADEWERVRLHPYHGERLLARSPGLSGIGALAALHHERCDGSGYHRGLDGRSLPAAARLLAAADAFHAMTEPRPHRAALSPEAASDELRGAARGGALDGDAVECVLVAAGRRPRRRRERAGGLTARESEVLRLLARGLATKQVAAALTITPKTADSHIQHIYAKLGVSTRAAATVFAMRHGLVDTLESSGELPM